MIREQVVVSYTWKIHSEMLEIVRNLVKDGNRIVSMLRTNDRDYIIVYEKPYDD